MQQCLGVELAFIRELSFFHPIDAAIGAEFVAAGVGDGKSGRRDESSVRDCGPVNEGQPTLCRVL
jgi:hypothetical protein